MSDTILKLKDIEDLIQSLTTRMLGLDEDDPKNADKVRISWPTGGAPAWGITDDVVFLRVNNSPNESITRQRETEYLPTYTEEDLDDDAKSIVSYTRVHTVQFLFYGPNSFDNADVIKNSLFKPEYKEELTKKNLFLILNVPDPIRFPELFNGQWWERTDFAISFNELVKRQGTVPWIKSTNIKLYTEKGEV